MARMQRMHRDAGPDNLLSLTLPGANRIMHRINKTTSLRGHTHLLPRCQVLPSIFHFDETRRRDLIRESE
jgi:hypothetical protein